MIELFTKQQEKQMEFLEGFLDKKFKFDCKCNDCVTFMDDLTAEQAMNFVEDHEGHYTWIAIRR